MDAPVIATKLVNALVTSAVLRDGVTDAASAGTGVDLIGVGWAVRRSKKKHGGLWVGGRATLTSTSLLFAPNSINRLVNSGELDIALELQDVLEVQVERALFTNIVQIHTAAATVKLRCYGAENFAELVSQQVARVRDET